MDQKPCVQGLPPEFLEALRTMVDGGVLSSVATLSSSPPLLIPCFFARVPTPGVELLNTPLELTTQFVLYDLEGPLVVFHLVLYDQPMSVHPVEFPRGLKGMQFQPGHPFEMECFLDPADEDERIMLEALAASSKMFVEFYGTDEAMTYLGSGYYLIPAAQQQIARDILAKTEGMVSSVEQFLAARRRFMDEFPL